MDTSKRLPLIIAAVVWLLLIVMPLSRALQGFRLLLIIGIPIGAAFYARARNEKSDRDSVGVFGPSPRRSVADESSARVGQPVHDMTPIDITSARTHWPVATVVAASVIFGIPVAINASENNSGLLTLCLVLWALVIAVTWIRVARWGARRGPLGGRFDVGEAGIQVYAGGTPSLIKRSDIHLVEIFNGWTNQSTISNHGMGVFIGTGAAGVASGAAFGGVAGAAALAGASHAKAERWNVEHAYQVRYRVGGKPYALVGGLSIETAQEVFWHLTGENPAH